MLAERQLTPLNAVALLIVFVLASILWFATLDYRHLIPTDEGRYAQMAREMMVSGDYITPRYNDYKYFEKPPLHIWASAITFQLFGLGEWQARFWSGLTGYLTILLVGFTAAKLFGRVTGYLAALILLSSPMWVVGGHFNALDMGLSAFLNLALCSLLLAQHAYEHHRPQSGRYWMWVCWLAMGLATLSKGLIGIVIPGMVLFAYIVTRFDWKILARLHIVSGLVIFLIVTAPWFIAVSIQNPEFAHFFFIHEHFERFTATAHRRTAPVYFFLPLVAIGFLPWMPQFFRSAWQTLRQYRIGSFSAPWMLWAWFAVILIFFSISRSKLPGYIMPVFPALAILAAKSIADYLESHAHHSIGWRLQTLFFTLLAITGFFFLSEIGRNGQPDEVDAYQAYTLWIVIALSCLLAFSLVASLLAKRNALLSIALFAFGFFLTATIAGTGHETLGRAVSGYDLVQKIKSQIPSDAKIYSVRLLDHTVPFYLERNTIMVEFTDELTFGAKQEPQKWIPTLNEFVIVWNQDPNAVAIMSPVKYDELKSLGLPMEELGRDSRRVVVRHPQEPLRQ
ncbi:glycosyltransferase family 39 protein [Polynucleobacter acidiphobus]|uniref:glycosyltransferase family 39 protein n=1 Tax=Polynucleobacter acidiphobus TaxID=556053 RepID=UPI000D3676E2|nr:glycosyltransferase family 39 protein [Polynucleobacter acidiphobus]